jgi:flagellar protein FliL
LLLIKRCEPGHLTNNRSSHSPRKAMATTPVPQTPPEPPPRKKRFVLIAVVALAVIAGAAGGAYYFLRGSHDAPAKEAVKPPVDPIFVALEPFTVNLQPNGRNRFLHVAVTLQVTNVKSQALLVQYLPEVRSRVLITLSNRTSETLMTPEEKSLLAGEILATLNRPLAANLSSAGISSVMFTTFMLQ